MLGTFLVAILALLHTSQALTDISPDLYKNKLKAPWGVNFKYNGMVHQNIDRVWVVTKIHIPREEEIQEEAMPIDLNCHFIWEDYEKALKEKDLDSSISNTIETMQSMCIHMSPYITYIRNKELYLREKVTKFYQGELYRALPDLEPLDHRQKRSVLGLLNAFSGLVTVGIEALSAHLQRKRMRAVHKSNRYLKK